MIKNIDTKSFINAMSVLETQLPAYKIEGNLIGFNGIPAMKETVESILSSEDTYVGYYENNQLVGFIAYNINEDTIEITKLVVHPTHFRKGIASQLLVQLLSLYSDALLFKVSTGTKNTPAVELYKKFGFQEVDHIEIATSVYITAFERVSYWIIW